MQILIEPKRLVELFEMCLMGQKLSNVILSFSDKVVRVNDATLGGLGVVGAFKPTYFMEYEIDEPEQVVISQTLLKIIKDAKSFTDEKVTLSTTEDEETGEKMVIIKGTGDEVEEKCEDITTEPFPYDIVSNKTKGITLKGKEPTLCIRVDKSQFSLPKIGETKSYNLVSDGENILVKIKDEGTKMERTIKPLKKDKIGELDSTFDGTFFDTMLALLPPDEVWVSIYGTGGGVILSVKTKEYALSYFLTPSQ